MATQTQQTQTATELTLAEQVERVLVSGDLKDLTPEMRVVYFRQVCDSLGLNPLTRPFDLMTLNGKTVMYAKKDCTEQLRSTRNVSVEIVSREVVDGICVVKARAYLPSGRQDESIGAVPMAGGPADKANAMMKAETKAKRRVTLSLCGLGLLDESETDTIHFGRDMQQAVAERRIEELNQPKGIAAGSPQGESPFDYKVMLEKFAEMKAALNAATGSDKLYYFCLSQGGGYEHANAIKTKADGARVYKLMQTELDAVGTPESSVAG